MRCSLGWGTGWDRGPAAGQGRWTPPGVQGLWRLSTHPLALWSRWAWDSDWSWSTLGGVKESKGEGPDVGGEPQEARPALEMSKVQRPIFRVGEARLIQGSHWTGASSCLGRGPRAERPPPASEPDLRRETLLLSHQACQG